MAGRALSPERAARVYDRIGKFQDWQGFYEGPAIRDLVAHADFASARRVVELGCGTGAMAAELLTRRLPPDATYLGLDVSSRMVGLASSRVSAFGARASVRRISGRPPLPVDDSAADRFVAVYVFDLLADELADAIIEEARRILTPGGRLCLVSLAPGATAGSRLLCAAWNRVWAHAPALVGGCRPVDLRPRLARGWRIEHERSITAWGVTSQVIVAARVAE
ncbi:MAG: class I SAM-dependent methyltransferase [Thermoleophilia bacterium]|nr:class I SAM-dependent methyltransferase [Thermoleophilia bacterium]